MEKAFEHEFFPVTIMYDNVARKTKNDRFKELF